MIAVLECGRLARAALAGGRGEVCAVFRRSLYLRFSGERYACLGDGSLGRGPLNARVADRDALQRLRVGDVASASVAQAKLWRPAAIPPGIGKQALSRNLRSLERALGRSPAQDGLGGAIVGARSPLLCHAQPALDALDGWLARPGAPVPEAVAALIGLGPGLTPSGDDSLGGAMLGLRALGKRTTATKLWRWLEPRAVLRTSAISRAHLAAAAQGEAHEALHACIARLLGAGARTGWPALLARLDAVGHCSGRDGLAGMVAVARQTAR